MHTAFLAYLRQSFSDDALMASVQEALERLAISTNSPQCDGKLLDSALAAASSATGVREEDLQLEYGAFLVSWVQMRGFDKLLLCLGRTFPDFLRSLTNLFLHLSIDMPGFAGIECHLQEVSMSSAQLCCRSQHQLPCIWVKGFLEEVALQVFNMRVTIEPVLQTPLMESQSKVYAITLPEGISWSSSSDTSPAPSSPRIMGLAPERFDELFPFHFVMDGELRIVQAGISLQRLVPSLAQPGVSVTEVLQLCHPQVPWTFDAIRQIQGPNTRLVVATFDGVELQGSVISSRGMCRGKDGALVEGEDEEHLMFLGSPYVYSLDDLKGHDMYLSDYTSCDAAVDIVLMSEQNMLDTERADQAHAKLKDTLAETLAAQEEGSGPRPGLSTDSPGNMIMKLLDKLIIEDEVDLQQVLAVRQALLRAGNNLWQPLDLTHAFQGNSEVTRALEGMLGITHHSGSHAEARRPGPHNSHHHSKPKPWSSPEVKSTKLKSPLRVVHGSPRADAIPAVTSIESQGGDQPTGFMGIDHRQGSDGDDAYATVGVEVGPAGGTVGVHGNGGAPSSGAFSTIPEGVDDGAQSMRRGSASLPRGATCDSGSLVGMVTASSPANVMGGAANRAAAEEGLSGRFAAGISSFLGHHRGDASHRSERGRMHGGQAATGPRSGAGEAAEQLPDRAPSFLGHIRRFLSCASLSCTSTEGVSSALSPQADRRLSPEPRQAQAESMHRSRSTNRSDDTAGGSGRKALAQRPAQQPAQRPGQQPQQPQHHDVDTKAEDVSVNYRSSALTFARSSTTTGGPYGPEDGRVLVPIFSPALARVSRMSQKFGFKTMSYNSLTHSNRSSRSSAGRFKAAHIPLTEIHVRTGEEPSVHGSGANHSNANSSGSLFMLPQHAPGSPRLMSPWLLKPRRASQGSPADVGLLMGAGLPAVRHARVSDTMVQGLTAEPSDQLMQVLAKADDWQYDAFKLDEASHGRPLSCMAFYLVKRMGLTKAMKLNETKLARFLLRIEEGYLQDIYHSRAHAADVLRSFHVLLTRGGVLDAVIAARGGEGQESARHDHADISESYPYKLKLLTCYLAAVIHDFEHRGLNNDFLIKSHDRLALLYNDSSPMENHHLAASFMLMAEEPHAFLPPGDLSMRDAMRKDLIEMVLATDMRQHFSLTGIFNSKVVAMRHDLRLSDFGGGHDAIMTSAPTATPNSRTLSAQRIHCPEGSAGSIQNGHSHMEPTSRPTGGPPALGRLSIFSRMSVPAQMLAPDKGVRVSPPSVARGGSCSTGHGGEGHSHAHATDSAQSSGAVSRMSSTTTMTAATPIPSSAVRRIEFSPQVRSMASSAPSGAAIGPDGLPIGGFARKSVHVAHEPVAYGPVPNLVRKSITSPRSGAVTGSGASGSGAPPAEPPSYSRTSHLTQCPSFRSATLGSGKASTGTLSRPTSQTLASPHNWDSESQIVVLKMALKCADLGHLASSRSVHIQWVHRLEEEMFRQGDQERALGQPVSALMDRTKGGITKAQSGFFNVVALPMFQSMAQVFPAATALVDSMKVNLAMWSDLEAHAAKSSAETQ